jgi:hypothetical protein
MRRFLVCLFAIAMTLAVAERRLSDGGRQPVPDPTPELWEQAHHTGPSNLSYCAMVTSVHRSDPYTLTAPDGGVSFDIDADGDLDQVSWTVPGSDVVFLALDRDENGRITNGGELIGDRTLRQVTNGPRALFELANEALGGEKQGTINSGNPLFSKLWLWADANHNGRSEDVELRPARDVVSDIGLGYERHHRKDRHGNQSRYRGFVHIRTDPGLNAISSAADDMRRRRPMYEVCLVTR